MPNGMAAQAVLNIILRAQDQTGKAFTGASNAVSRFGQATSKVGGILTKTLTPAILAVGAATIKMATDAAVVKQMSDGFELMAESVGVNAAQALERMSGATKGLISDADLMRIANKALAGSSEAVRAAFFENLPTLEAFALRMSQIQGIPLDVTLDKLITGLKRMSPKLIDDTGLMFKMGDVTERASEMFGKAAEELSAEEQQLALLEIVGAKAAEQMGIVGDIHIGLNEKLKATRVQFQNVKDTLGEALIPVVSTLAEALADVMAQLTPLIERFAKFITNFIKAHPEATKVILVVAGLAAALGPLLIIVGQVAMAISALAPILGIVGGALTLLTGPIGLVVAAIALLAVAWAKDWGGIREKTKAAIDKIRTFITNLRLAIEVFLYNLPNQVRAFKQAGINLIRGMTEGVMMAARKLVEAVVKAVRAAIIAAKRVLGIGSPSAVFAEIGMNMRQGLLQGFASGLGGLVQNFEAGGLVPGLGPKLAVVHGGETITPAGRGGDIVVPVYLDGREIARVISPYLGEEYRRERGLRV